MSWSHPHRRGTLVLWRQCRRARVPGRRRRGRRFFRRVPRVPPHAPRRVSLPRSGSRRSSSWSIPTPGSRFCPTPRWRRPERRSASICSSNSRGARSKPPPRSARGYRTWIGSCGGPITRRGRGRPVRDPIARHRGSRARAVAAGDHRHPAVPADGRRVRCPGRAGDLRLPRPCLRSRPGHGGAGQQSPAPLAARAAGADGELADHRQRGHRVCQLAAHPVGAVAECGTATVFPVGATLRRPGREDAGLRQHPRSGDGLLGCAVVGSSAHHRDPHQRRPGHRARDRAARRPGAGIGHHRTVRTRARGSRPAGRRRPTAGGVLARRA